MEPSKIDYDELSQLALVADSMIKQEERVYSKISKLEK
jgi:hypothetical protein